MLLVVWFCALHLKIIHKKTVHMSRIHSVVGLLALTTFFLLFKIFKRFFLMLNSLALDGKQDNHFANADIQLLCTDTRYLKRFKYSFTSSN